MVRFALMMTMESKPLTSVQQKLDLVPVRVNMTIIMSESVRINPMSRGKIKVPAALEAAMKLRLFAHMECSCLRWIPTARILMFSESPSIVQSCTFSFKLFEPLTHDTTPETAPANGHAPSRPPETPPC